MKTFRKRMSNDSTRVTDKSKTYYSLFVSIDKDSDRENLEKAISKLESRIVAKPSNPMVLSILLREFVDNNEDARS